MTIQPLGKITVTTPGTPVRVTSQTGLRASRMLFATDPSDTGAIYLGVAGMVKATRAGVIRVFTAPGTGPQDGLVLQTDRQTVNPGDYYIDADNAGQGLLVTLWLSTP